MSGEGADGIILSTMHQVPIILGSASDTPTVEPTKAILAEFGISGEIIVCSAHRNPRQLVKLIEEWEKKTDVFIACAGKAAALPGVIAAHTAKPVIGIPGKTSDLGGLDSLYSIVQMPSGVPVACVAINGGQNAGILAAQMIAIRDPDVAEKLRQYKLKLGQS